MRKGMTVREAILWLTFTIFASSIALWIIDYGHELFIENSLTMITRNLPKLDQ